MPVIRSRPGDAPALTAIAFEAKRAWDYPEKWIQAWAGALTLTPEAIAAHPTFCAVEDGGIAGFSALRLEGAVAWVEHLWVRPRFWGRGVGRALFAACEAAAREAGASALRIEADPHAEGFYAAMGSVARGSTPAPMEGTARALPLMEKGLR